MTEMDLRKIIREESGIRPELLMLKDVAAMLNISLPSARRLRDTGAIPFYLLAGKKMFKRSDVMDFIERLPRGGEPPWKAENAAAI